MTAPMASARSCLSDWTATARIAVEPFLRELLVWLLLLVVYRLIQAWWLSSTKLVEATARNWSLLEGALQGPRGLGLLAAILVVLLIAAPVRWSQLGKTTETDQNDDQARLALLLRLLISANALVIGWTGTFYEYNFFLDQWHGLDRILCGTCALLTFWRPVFAPLTALLGLLIQYQFEVPLPGFPWTDKRILIDSLMLFLAYLLLQRLSTRFSPLVYLGVLLSIVGCHYVMPAIAKLRLDWFDTERLSYLFVSSHLYGWWSHWSQKDVLAWAAWMDAWNWWLVRSVVLTEIVALFLLTSRRLCAGLLFSFAGLHAVIFLLTGICFWMWIVLDLVLMGVICGLPASASRAFFTRQRLLVSITLMLAGTSLIRAFPLGWYDTRLTEQFRLVAHTDDGGQVALSPDDFAPYDVIVAQNRFFFLHDHPVRVGTYSTCLSHDISTRLNRIDDPAELRDLETIVAPSQYDLTEREDFSRFLQAFLDHRLNGQQGRHVPSWLQPPHHIYVHSPPLPKEEAYVAAEVIFQQQLNLGDEIVTTAVRPVLWVDDDQLTPGQETPAILMHAVGERSSLTR